MRAFQLFPKTSRLVLGTASRLITPSPIDITDTGGQVRKYSIEQHLSKQALRICTCGEEPRSDHLQFVLAFNAGQVQLGTTALPSTSEASECVWVVHHVTAKEDRSVKCITEGSFLLSCFASKALDATSATDFHTRMSTMIYRFENQTELTITRATDGWLTLRETTLDPATGLLCQHTGVNAGMKCRCRARGASLLGAARAHSFGPYVREIGGNVSGFLSKGGRQKEPISSEVFLMPPVGDERMISLLANCFAGKESSLDALSSDLSLSSQTKTATVSQHYTAAAFVWNNLLGGKLLFAGAEARLQPWALLLPAVLSNMSASQRANLEVKNIDVAAFALLDQVRRTVEAHLQEGSYAVVPAEYVGN